MKYLLHLVIASTLLLSAFYFRNIMSENTTGLITITYETTDEHFPNPERGFYRFAPGTLTSLPLHPDTLRNYRNQGQTLVFRPYMLRDFIESDISDEFLNKMRVDFETLRQTGLKTIFKFRYSTAIGQPDAPLERVLNHLNQLEPLFREYSDVIAVVQAGFIGAWGEWHASTNDLTTTENMRIISHKLMDALPENRHIQIRYPAAKMQIFSSLEPIRPEDAHDGSYKSRSGHHNDCFLASPTDVGTYWLGRYTDPIFNSVRDTMTMDWAKRYLSADTRYTPMGGETCNPRPDAGDRYHCPTALHELEWLNYSFLNYNYSRRILDVWIEQGCMPEIERRMGYRFVLKEGTFSTKAAPGGSIQFQLTLKNEGFAAPYNPRDVQVILRDAASPERIYRLKLPDDPRFWLGGGIIALQYELGLPVNIPDGTYDLLFNLPDLAEIINHKPEFSIRIANSDIWETSTGYNRLKHQLIIDASEQLTGYNGELIFKQN